MKNTKRAVMAIAGACVLGALGVTAPAHAAPVDRTQDSALSVLGALKVAAADAHAYFISPAGNDSNPGTQDAPFRTLMKAQSAAAAGDVVYIRGGTYNQFDIPETNNPFEDVYHYVNDINKSGITYSAYPGDPRPVFDFSGVPTDQRVAAFYVETQVTDVNFVGSM